MTQERPVKDTPSSRRARRRTTKTINYAKEQNFSDSDVFEDSEEEAPAPKRGRGRPRKSDVADQREEGNDDGVFGKKIVYTERGYDPNLPPIRERFPFLPEYEPDGSPRIDCIVGRRPVDQKEKKDKQKDDNDEDADPESDAEGEGRRSSRSKKKNTKASPKKKDSAAGPVDYEYLIKYKNRSYLHLEWKRGADLESMNKSAKALYRRYLKKIVNGDEELEDPNFDPSFAIAQKILDEAEQEITVELTDKELLKWEKQREKEMEEEEDDEEMEDTDENEKTDNKTKETEEKPNEVESENKDNTGTADGGKVEVGVGNWKDEDLDFSKLTLDHLRAIVNSDGPYYASFEGSTNPYRDGYITEPPKKPRASYLFFQCTMRSYFQKRNPSATQGELMTILGDTWRTMSEPEQAPFIELAKEEAAQYDKERALMEKAQRPNEMWQPMRRCLMVLDRISADGFANIFLEPVSTTDFPDYEEVIDQPMDLGTIREKLGRRKFQAPEQFARDMRKVWNNCKIYNQHGSAIWHVADYMSKVFERLYHAWVLEFRERYLRWVHPRARPWEPTCRQCDGKCNTPDDQMVLCDHCDALYGFRCLPKPLKKLPTGVWHCADCKPKINSVKGGRMLSAVAEQAARKRAELGDTPKKKINQTMFLVKWAGLGYEYCTWETKEDVNANQLVNEYRRLNSTFPDEPDMPEEVINKVLNSTKHINAGNAGGSSCLPDLRQQLYAQTCALHFLKFGMELPNPLSHICGPTTNASNVDLPGNTASNTACPRDVVSCVFGLVDFVSRKDSLDKLKYPSTLPPLMTGEYDAVVPITSKGLMMNVGEIHGSVAFLGYRAFPDGSKGPAEISNIIRNVGDKIIAVDGVSTIKKSFKEVINMLRESGKNKFAFMRFLENKFSVCDTGLVSVGNTGIHVIDELQERFSMDRELLLLRRKQQLVAEEEEKDDEEESDVSAAPQNSDDESDDGSEGEFQPDSEDDEMVVKRALNMNEGKSDSSNPPKPDENGEGAKEQIQDENSNAGKESSNTAEVPSTTMTRKESSQTIRLRKETTRSLAFRFLDVDVGNSSDEGGDEDCAFFFDGMDETFNTEGQMREQLQDDDENDDTDGGKMKGSASNGDVTVPVKRNEFSQLGDRAKFAASVILAKIPPNPVAYDQFPFPANKENDPSKQMEKLGTTEDSTLESPKSSKRSTVKVEQISTETNEVIHIWASAEAAAATLQIPLNEIKGVLKGDYNEDLGDEIGGFRWRFALAGAKVTAGGGGGRGKKGKEAWLEFRDKLYDPNEPHSYKNGNRLRDYQVDGVNWLASTYYKRHGCILADEMGLGKTVQIVSYIEHLYRVEKIHRPYLVVVPLSTVEHWRREFEGWTDMICCVYHDRQRVWRDVLREYEWYYRDRPHNAEFLKFDVLVTTYDTLIGDFDVISQIPFRVAVVDEAHRLRNQKGKLLECMREISAKGTLQYGFQSRVLISGTPLQNDLNELWTLLNFIEPFKFPDRDDFQRRFGNMANREQVEALQQIISPFMLRRVKEDVAKDIPAKEETVIDVELTSIQKQYYRAIFEHNHAFLSMGATRSNAPKLMNIQMELRKVCNHPFLLEGVEHREAENHYKQLQESGQFDAKTPEEQQHMLNEHGYIMTSGKMVLLDKLLPKLRQEGHKILIFSQMVKMLDFISEYCEFRNYPYERLDGRVRGTERQKSIDRFEKDENSFLFLLSTRAGGVGINLTAADICIIFDSDWNPQNDIQAQARCHRIGQTKDVRIYRLITSRTFEQEMFDRASKKLGLEQAVLGTFGQDNDDDKPTNQEMEQLLKKGAYALLEDENDEEGKAFCADDIENILAKRTRTRVVEGAKTASWLNKQGMVVSKSKFTSESGGAALDMDDPLFWQKVMPDFVTPSIINQKLNDLSDQILGTSKKSKGRGRGRKKKTEEPVVEPKKEEPKEEVVPEEEDEDEDEEQGEVADQKGGKFQLTRTNQRKVHKFMSDLKSMMEGIFDEAEEDSLPSVEKATCQKLLLAISINEKLFNEQQRHTARMMLKRLEGDRRRRCRQSDIPSRFSPGKALREEEDYGGPSIREELRIVGKKQRRKRRKKGEIEAERKRKELNSDDELPEGTYVGEDGYLHHSDSEADWSDVGEGLYQSDKKNNLISKKEAKRRRQWSADDDAATAAGRPWPVFPRIHVKKVVTTVLDEVMKYDESKGGLFSVPVPRDEFPEYYEQIKNPMDYGSMKEKLDRGEYRSAQALQKDFILVMQNCLQFNSPDSDIVKEAREQMLMRPSILRNAALKHNLFLAEDGSVLEMIEEDAKKGEKSKRGRKPKNSSDDKGDNGKGLKDDVPIPRKKRGRKKKEKEKEEEEEGEIAEDDPEEGQEKKVVKKKPRIRIRMGQATENNGDGANDGKQKRGRKRMPKRKRSASPVEEGEVAEKDLLASPIPKRKRRAVDNGGKNEGSSRISRRKSAATSKGEDRKDESDTNKAGDTEATSATTRKRTSAGNDSDTESDGAMEEYSKIFLNLAHWKSVREKLDGSFKAARANLTRYGPWVFPPGISESKFRLVARATLVKMDRHDQYSVFAEAVSESEAPGYHDAIKNPMDFGTMREKVEKKEYGSGARALEKFYEDFLLVFDNCSDYNPEDGEVVEEASRLLGLLPESFVSACVAVAKRNAK